MFLAFLTPSFQNFLIFFVYQHWIWFLGGILSTKVFNANFFNFRMKFFICLMKLCPKFLKTMSSQNVHTVVKIFTPVLATRMHSISLSSQFFKGIVFTQLCYDFHRVYPWLAYNSTMTSNPNTLKFLQQQWLQSLKITQVVPTLGYVKSVQVGKNNQTCEILETLNCL